MTPIEKYKEKFIDLLKEMEAEIGEGLEVKVGSAIREVQDKNTYYGANQHVKKYETVYKFGVQTTNYYL